MYTSTPYRSSPPWVQELMLSARFGVRRYLREGRSLAPELKDVEQSQWFDREQLEALQLRKLRATFDHAIRHVPFYRDLYGKAGLKAGDLKSLADVARLPEIDKPDVLAAGDAMVSDQKRGPRFASSSSGTTGAHVVAWRDLYSIIRENAFLVRQMQWAGVKPGQRRVWLRGDKIVPYSQQHEPFWRRNYADNSLMMSSYHLSEARIGSYVSTMEDFDPVFIQAYPSAIVYIAGVLDGAGVRYGGPSLRAILTSSEMITEAQKRLVTRVFGCPVFDWYGNFERVAAIGTCEHGRYHLISDYSYMELRPMDGAGCEIVGTSFDNLAMPWIRYQVHDLVTPDTSGRQCECRRHFPIIASIEGRGQDYLLAPRGRRVFMPINAFDDIPGLVEGQFVQNATDGVEVLCKLASGSTTTVSDIESTIRNYVGPDLGIHVRLVDQVPRTQNGKLRPVIRTVRE